MAGQHQKSDHIRLNVDLQNNGGYAIDLARLLVTDTKYEMVRKIHDKIDECITQIALGQQNPNPARYRLDKTILPRKNVGTPVDLRNIQNTGDLRAIRSKLSYWKGKGYDGIVVVGAVTPEMAQHCGGGNAEDVANEVKKSLIDEYKYPAEEYEEDDRFTNESKSPGKKAGGNEVAVLYIAFGS